MNIYLIRHGQKEDDDLNSDASELTPLGYRQADLLGQRLTRHSIGKIYSSGMVRAIQTAREISRHTGAEVIIKPELREICMGACDTSILKYNRTKHTFLVHSVNDYSHLEALEEKNERKDRA